MQNETVAFQKRLCLLSMQLFLFYGNQYQQLQSVIEALCWALLCNTAARPQQYISEFLTGPRLTNLPHQTNKETEESTGLKLLSCAYSVHSMRDPRTNQGVLIVHVMSSWYRKLGMYIHTCYIMLCIPLLPALTPIRQSLPQPNKIPVKVFKTVLCF